jgi:DNA-binding NtrC family response regulator
MRAPSSENERFVNCAALGELLQAFEGQRHIPEVPGMRLEVALRALRQGMSLGEILRQAIWQLEKGVILRALEVTQGNKAAAARLLQIDSKTLYRKIRKYVI